ncbi:ankrd52 [Symbiodinium natans]|uniref:Ankrd52 protein n=1 Tax=Symbiodinium natans TaxID=878477 RepID=A0A812UUX2_9DINO|nr:ankrd52 [Symbiodinium natans]
MLEAGLLTLFVESLGRALFVSHEWLGKSHPDPDSRQLKVLQDALKNIMSGRSRVGLPIVTEMYYGRLPCPTAADLKSKPLFIWYDYLCVPQGSSPDAIKNRQHAINSIPSYVARCEYFVILCPELQHMDQPRILSQSSWADRGWCRTERLARELAARDDGFMIVVSSPVHQSLVFDMNRCLEAPGLGKFTFEADRKKVGNVIVQMVWNKLHHHLARGDLHKYRFLLNSQSTRCLQNLDVDPIDGLVPGFHSDENPFTDPKAFLLDWFMHQNGFKSYTDYDSGGWSPLCFAVMRGNTALVQSLLDRHASPNDATQKPKKEMVFGRNLSVLSIAAIYNSNEVMHVLLEARANVNARDSHYGTPLHWANISNNSEGVRILCQAAADPNVRCFPGLTPFETACACSAISAMREMLAQIPSTSLKRSLHWALMFHGGSTDTVRFLIDARANVDERFDVSVKEPTWWLLLTGASMKHRVSPSNFTSLAYHRRGATPLMFSILSGYFEAAAVLLAAGARFGVQNSRRKTAADLARDSLAPSLLLTRMGK